MEENVDERYESKFYDYTQPLTFQKKSKTLVIVLGETRAHELTFDNFKKNHFFLILKISIKLMRLNYFNLEIYFFLNRKFLLIALSNIFLILKFIC